MDLSGMQRDIDKAREKAGIIPAQRDGFFGEISDSYRLGMAQFKRSLGTTAEELGFNSAGVATRHEAENYIRDNQQLQQSEDYSPLSLSPSDLGRTVGSVAASTTGVAVAGLLGTAAGGPVVGASMGASVAFGQRYGDKVQEYRQELPEDSKDMAESLAFGVSAAMGIFESFLGPEAVASKALSRAFTQEGLKQVSHRLASKGFINFPFQMLITAGPEVAEEWIEPYLDVAAMKAGGKDDVKLPTWEELRDAGAAAAIGSMVLGFLPVTANVIMDKRGADMAARQEAAKASVDQTPPISLPNGLGDARKAGDDWIVSQNGKEAIFPAKSQDPKIQTFYQYLEGVAKAKTPEKDPAAVPIKGNAAPNNSAAQVPAEVESMSQSEFADWLIKNPNHPGNLYSLLSLPPNLRAIGTDPQELTKATGVDISASKKKSEELTSIWEDVSKENSGVNTGVKPVSVDSGWNSFELNQGASSATAAANGYVTLKNPMKLNKPMVVGLLNALQDAGYNGQLRIPKTGFKLAFSFDNIVLKGATEADVKVGIDAANSYLKDEIKSTMTGVDQEINGKKKSHTEFLANQVAEARKKQNSNNPTATSVKTPEPSTSLNAESAKPPPSKPVSVPAVMTEIEQARALVPKIFLSPEDRRELVNSGITISPRYWTSDRVFMDYSEAATMISEKLPGLGLRPDSELSEVIRKLFVGNAKESGTVKGSEDEGFVYAKDLRVGDIVTGQTVVDVDADTNETILVDGAGKIQRMKPEVAAAKPSEITKASPSEIDQARVLAGIQETESSDPRDAVVDQTASQTDDVPFSVELPPSKPGPGVSVGELVKRIGKLNAAGQVVVVKSVNEIPEVAKQKADRRGIDISTIEGLVHGDNVYLIADNLTSAERAEMVALHELIGHLGLRKVLGAKFDQTMEQIFKSLPKDDLNRIATLYGVDLSKVDGRREAVEELLARMAENPKQAPQLWDRVVAAVRQILRDLGFVGEFTDADIRALLGKAREAVQGDESDVKFSIADQDQKWKNSLNDFINGKLDRSRSIKIGETPDILVAVGADQLPITIPASVIEKATTGKHDIALSELEKLPESIRDPIAVFQSAKEPDSLVLMTEMKENGKTTVVAIHLNRKENWVEVNSIRSVYGKESDSAFLQWESDGMLLYVNKKKALAWSRPRGVQFPKGKSTSKLNKKILTEDDVFNRQYIPDRNKRFGDARVLKKRASESPAPGQAGASDSSTPGTLPGLQSESIPKPQESRDSKESSPNSTSKDDSGQVSSNISESDNDNGPLFSLTDRVAELSPVEIKSLLDYALDPKNKRPRPDLANPVSNAGSRAVVDVTDKLRNDLGMPGKQTVKEWQDKAIERFRDSGAAALWKQLQDGELDLENPVNTLIAKRLLDEYGTEAIKNMDPDRIKSAMLAVNRYRQARSEIARAMRAGFDPEKTPLERVRGIINGAFLDPGKALAGADKMTAEELTKKIEELTKQLEDVKKRLKEKGIDLDNLKDEDVNDPKKLADILGSINEAKASKFDMIYEYWLNWGLLSMPTTHAANILGNTVYAVSELTAQRLTEAIINLAAGKSGAATFGEFRWMLGALKNNWRQAIKNGLLTWQTEESLTGRDSFELDYNRSTAGKLGKVVRAPTRFLRMADEIAKSILVPIEASAKAYRMANSEGLKGADLEERIHNLVGDPDSDAHVFARARSLELTFQQKPGIIAMWLLQARAFPRYGVAFKFLLPFISTPANIIRTTLRKSPLGLMNLLANASAAAFGKGKYANNADLAIRHAAEQVIAFGVLGTLYSMIGDDEDEPWITGSKPNQRQSGKKQFMQANLPPVSIRIGNRWFSYNRIEPFAGALAMMVDGLHALRNAKNGQDGGLIMKDLVNSAIQNIRDKTFLQTIGDIVRAMESPDKAGGIVSNFIASWVPNAVRGTLRAFDDTVRDTKNYGRGWQYFTNQLTDQVLVSAGLMRPVPKVDLWGNEIEKTERLGDVGDFIWRVTMPVYTSQPEGMSPAEQMIWRWNQANPNEPYWPDVPNWWVTRDGKTKYMSAEKHLEYAKLSGRFAKEMTDRYIQAGLNVNTPRPADIKRLQAIFTRARSRAKKDLGL